MATSPKFHCFLATCAAFALPGLQSLTADAGCGCNSGSYIASVMPMPVQMPMTAPAPVHVPRVTMAPRARPTLAIPKGTMGRTYSLRSRPIPYDKHPRIAMMEVHVPGATEVTADNMTSFHKGDNIWILETEDELLPEVPPIVAVKAKRLYQDGVTRQDVRYIRLIPGRIISWSYMVDYQTGLIKRPR